MTESTLELWQTPFTTSFGSVALVIGPESLNDAYVIIAPEGIDKYPKYQVHFSFALAAKTSDESFDYLRTDIPEKPDSKSHCFLWRNSPWLEDYQALTDLLESQGGKAAQHYLFLGADSNVEVIAALEPSIEEMKQAWEIAGRFSF